MIGNKLFYSAISMLFLIGIGQPAFASDPLSVYNSIPDDMSKVLYRTKVGAPGNKLVHYMNGWVYAYIPGDTECDPADGPCTGTTFTNPKRAGTRLFGFEGYSVRSLQSHPDDNTLFWGSREIVFYTDPKTGAILDVWENPFNGDTVPVFPIMNEFMDRSESTDLYTSSTPHYPYSPVEEWGTDYVTFMDVFFNYSVREKFTENDNMNLINGLYTPVELSDFFIPKDSIADLKCADYYLNKTEANKDKDKEKECPGGSEEWLSWHPRTNVTWTRVGAWLPWMGMSEVPGSKHYAPGALVYHMRADSKRRFEDLPKDFQTKMIKWFDEGANGLKTIGFDAWMQPNTYEQYLALQPHNNHDSTWSTFYEKVLKPQNLTWEKWVDSGYPMPK